MRPLVLKILLLTSIFASSGSAWAGILFAPNIAWSSYAFRPLDEEDTPNYYGYGFGGTLGYSIGQVFDVATFYQYTPGNLGSANPNDSNSDLSMYGGLLGLRLYRTIYFNLHAGIADYRLPRRAKAEEVEGSYNGLGYGFALGGLVEMNENWSWQIALQATTINAIDIDDSSVPERTIDLFAVSIGLVYNSDDTLGFVDALFSRSINKLFR